MSTHVGVYMTDYIDVHTIEDVEEVEKRLRSEVSEWKKQTFCGQAGSVLRRAFL